ncbi:unnamed protein product [Rodentolepis nana]|uniref:Ribosome biogenesis protein slx9-like n=1 Tax=Rodentolepis nana TaxID=102285 RepID=A0A0R3U0T8_RODNA|nr:unnamed protein product [Rodentolepis nana]
MTPLALVLFVRTNALSYSPFICDLDFAIKSRECSFVCTYVHFLLTDYCGHSSYEELIFRNILLWNLKPSFHIIISNKTAQPGKFLVSEIELFLSFVLQAPALKQKRSTQRRAKRPVKLKDNEHLKDILKDFSDKKP